MSMTGRSHKKNQRMMRSPPYVEPSSVPGIQPQISSFDRALWNVTYSQQMQPQQSASYKYQIHFNNYSPTNFSNSHPQVIVHTRFRDLNEVIKEIVNERQPAPPVPHFQQSVSFTCPISGIPITCPGRGVQCRHPGCFDLRQFLIKSSGEPTQCPFCKLPLCFEDLRFDPSFFSCSVSMEPTGNESFPQVPEDDNWVYD